MEVEGKRVTDSMIAAAGDKLVDQPFFLGDTTNRRGYDCLNSLKSFYVDLGFNFPNSFEGYTWENYAEKWNEDPERARDALIRFLSSLGEPVAPNYWRRGDLLIIAAKSLPDLDKSRIRKVLDHVGKHFPNLAIEAKKILSGKKLLVFPAIYTGNGHILIVATSALDHFGPRTMPLRLFRDYVSTARRLI